MNDILRNFPEEQQRQKAWLFGFVLAGYVSISMLLGNSGEVDTNQILSMDPILLLGGQSFISAIMFIGVPALFIVKGLRINFMEFFPKVDWQSIGLTLVISFSFMVVNSAIGEWNMSIDFPDSAFEDWAAQSEEQLKILTEHLTNFTSPTHFTIAFVVIAIIPAIGEELLFRGLIQNLFGKAFNNHHIAIWITGFIFAAIHMQFYGLFPRMLLGVVFGYLYHWSGKLSIAMIAHLINNGLALILIYLSQNGTIEVSPDQMESSAPWTAIIGFAGICGYCLFIFYKKFRLQEDA
ncbi:MAG: lysostaphin resistance A-like protein [Ekhidna sp.]